MGIIPSSVLSPRGNAKSSGEVVVMVTGALDPQGLYKKDTLCEQCFLSPLVHYELLMYYATLSHIIVGSLRGGLSYPK